jgi:exonuclease SbcC
MEILSAEARRLENAFGDLRNKNEELAGRLSGAETECEALKQQKSLLEAHPNSPSCPLCATPLEPDRHYKLVQENEQKLVHVRMAIAALQKERELLRKQGMETRKALEAAREKSVRARERVAALEARVAEAKRRQPLLVRELQEAKERLKSATERVSRLEAERRELQAVAAKAHQVEALLADSRRHRGELEAARERLVERLGSLSEQIAQAQAARENVIALRRDSQAERRRARECEFLERAFGKDGIPALIIEGVCPQLEQEANRLLAELTGGRIQLGIRTLREKKSGGFSEALDIVVQDELGARPLELFSGGEAFRVNFAIRIALSELVASQAGGRISTLIIDEGFGTQDAEGRELLVDAIRAISERFDLIVIVTHIDELRNEFPVRVEVRKGPEGSRFEVIVA